MKPGIGLIGKKLGMTQLFKEDGRPVAVTVLAAGPCPVVQMKNPEKDGYRAVQLGFGDCNLRRVQKPAAGHCAKANTAPKQVLKEFRLPAGQVGLPEQTALPGGEALAVGGSVTVELFKPGDRVDITGNSIGKGFQGGVKRWHWKGGPATHGSMSHRRPGSIGSSTNPSRVFKGHHLPGRMGNETVTIQALEVVRVDSSQNLLLIKGSVPGHDQSVVFIRKSRKPPRVKVAPVHKKKQTQVAPKAQAAGKAPASAKAPSPAKEKKGKAEGGAG